MATHAGYNGRIVYYDSSYNNYVLNAYNWTVSYDAGEGETTDFTSTGAKTFLPLTTEWSGSATLRLDGTTAIPDLDNTLTYIWLFINYVEGTTEFGYRGTAFTTAMNPGVDVNGLPELTLNFRGSAVLTIGNIAGPLRVTDCTGNLDANGDYAYNGVANGRLEFAGSDGFLIQWDGVDTWWITDTTDTWAYVPTSTLSGPVYDGYGAVGGAAAGTPDVRWADNA